MYMRVQCTLHVLKYTNCKARRFLCVHCTCMYMYIHVEYIAPAHAQLIHLSSNWRTKSHDCGKPRLRILSVISSSDNDPDKSVNSTTYDEPCDWGACIMWRGWGEGALGCIIPPWEGGTTEPPGGIGGGPRRPTCPGATPSNPVPLAGGTCSIPPGTCPGPGGPGGILANPGTLGPPDGGGWYWLAEGPCPVMEFLPERGDLEYCPPPPPIAAALRGVCKFMYGQVILIYMPRLLMRAIHTEYDIHTCTHVDYIHHIMYMYTACWYLALNH